MFAALLRTWCFFAQIQDRARLLASSWRRLSIASFFSITSPFRKRLILTKPISLLRRQTLRPGFGIPSGSFLTASSFVLSPILRGICHVCFAFFKKADLAARPGSRLGWVQRLHRICPGPATNYNESSETAPDCVGSQRIPKDNSAIPSGDRPGSARRRR